MVVLSILILSQFGSPFGAEERLWVIITLKVFPFESQVPRVLGRMEGLAFPDSLLQSVLNSGGVCMGYAPVTISSSSQVCGFAWSE